MLGIDPGTARMGWGVVRQRPQDDEFELVAYGVITTSPQQSPPKRLQLIYSELVELLNQWQPGQMVVEELFFNKNTTTVIAVGQARGVALLAAANHEIEVYEYTPLQVKQSLIGYGRATKDQVQQMVQVMLGLDHIPQPDDAADALAVAMCYFRSRRYEDRLRGNLET